MQQMKNAMKAVSAYAARFGGGGRLRAELNCAARFGCELAAANSRMNLIENASSVVNAGMRIYQ